MSRTTFASHWYNALCDAWWEAWLTLWAGVEASLAGTYWEKSDLAADYPDLADAHVDFGGGDG